MLTQTFSSKDFLLDTPQVDLIVNSMALTFVLEVDEMDREPGRGSRATAALGSSSTAQLLIQWLVELRVFMQLVDDGSLTKT